MATPKTKISPKELEELAYLYIDECLLNTKEVAMNSGKILAIKDRHLPTIDYFLRIWIPKYGSPTISRATYYNWLDIDEDSKKFTEEHKQKLDTIKSIDNLFKALSTDIVANEGKGIFYAKNKLGMTDKQALDQNLSVEKPIIISLGSGINPDE